jgi:dienelactone hydrolase
LPAEADGVWLALISRVAALILNGRPVYGDVYGYRHTRVPVRLEKGENDLFAVGFRWPFQLELERPPAPVFVEPLDPTLPELVPGETIEPHAAVLVTNAQDLRVRGLNIEAVVKAGKTQVQAGTRLASLIPLGQEKVALVFPSLRVPSDVSEATLEVEVSDCDEVLHRHVFELVIRKPDEARRRTFVSEIDGSVQFYAERSPQGERIEGQSRGIVLSLHGAAVDAHNQARAYAAKPDLWIVAPTNRRPFGFDWQDWGRWDAYEVLDDVLRRTEIDRRRVWLTGHSMGGHGTWHLAVNDPDGFGAIAPSAAWVSFDTYGRSGQPAGPLARIWKASDLASDTLALKSNLAHLPIRQLHGGADDNVPPAEARRMEAELKDTALDYELEIVEGKGHWWDGDASAGADCVDWPPFFETFRKHPVPVAPESLRFETAGPEVDATHHWVTLQQPLRLGERLAVHAQKAEDRLALKTENVRRLVLHPPATWSISKVVVDHTTLPWPQGEPALALLRVGPHWRPTTLDVPAGERSPTRSGPFKRVFDRRFVLVYATGGEDAENATSLQRARYDAERWRYRANGRAQVMPDLYLAENLERFAGRNVVLYGNATTNRAWDMVFDEGCPIRLENGKATVGSKTFEGDDLAAYFLHPRKGDDEALAGAVAWTGSPGERLTILSGYLASGEGYPDYVVFGPDVLSKGDYGVKAAGFFDVAWGVAE